MDTTLFTGFPGFIGRHLLRRLLAGPGRDYIFLVQDRLVGRAEDELRALEIEIPALKGHWDLLVGDIAERRLGMAQADYDALTASVTTVWHLAGIYNLAVDERVAYRINVTGTINILDLCEDAPNLERLNYVSTCYVSGARSGQIREAELDEGQAFKNHYESTKFWAEMEVQRRRKTVPSTIFRPGITVGDSITGETDKYDGPYYIMKLIERMPEALPLLNVGRGTSRVNLVPVDYVVDAMSTIAASNTTTGKVFHIADPDPMRATDVLDLILDVMGRPPAIGSLPQLLVDGALRLKGVRKRLNVPREVIVYFNHDAMYDVRNTLEALEGTGVRCPHLSGYLDTLVDYMRKHPEKAFLDRRAV